MSAQKSSLYLSPDQQDLLMAALSSNQSPPGKSSSRPDSQSTPKDTVNGNELFESPPNAFGYSPDENSYLGFDVDGEFDENYDYNGNGELNDYDDEESTPNDLHEKRKSIDGKDEDDEGGGKRREGDDKSGKKPGRKPLTSEPTSKRKAQNRAAQRAFRERKEKHLKDLETKVEDLEKSSESTSHENGLLRAQVERLQVELKEYRKRLSLVNSNGGPRPQHPSGFGSQIRSNIASGNDFQFEFPKFGDLPTLPSLNNSATQNKQSNPPGRSSTLPTQGRNQSPQATIARASLSSASPKGLAPTWGSTGNSPLHQRYSVSPVSKAQPVKEHQDSIDSLTGLFSPSILEASRNSGYGYFPQQNGNANRTGRSSFDNSLAGNVPPMYASSSNTDSPSSSSDSHQPTSSMGTSPEPSLNSPGTKQNDFGLNTINENQISNIFGEDSFCQKLALACGNSMNPIPPIMSMSNENALGSAITPGFDSNGINWLAQQNGGAFDPILFGDYRESQDAVVSQDFGSFFNDAFPLPDLGSPEHNFNDVAPEPALKVDLMKQVEAAKEGEEEVVPGEDRAKMMNCNKIWDRLQSMEKFRNGEIDVDNLCSELRAKARCSEGGAVVEEKDFNKIVGNAK